MIEAKIYETRRNMKSVPKAAKRFKLLCHNLDTGGLWVLPLPLSGHHIYSF